MCTKCNPQLPNPQGTLNGAFGLSKFPFSQRGSAFIEKSSLIFNKQIIKSSFLIKVKSKNKNLYFLEVIKKF